MDELMNVVNYLTILFLSVSFFLFLLLSNAHLERAHQGLINSHHGTGIVKLAAIVGRREHRHQLPLGKELVAILHDL